MVLTNLQLMRDPGLISIPANIYIAEMASSSMRCMLITWPSIAISIGILWIYALGLVVNNWRIIAGISTIVPVFTAISISICIRESPLWLIAKGRFEEAEQSFRWIRYINSEDMPMEFGNEFQAIMKNSSRFEVISNRASESYPEDATFLEPLRKNVETSYGAHGISGPQMEEKEHRSIFEKIINMLSNLKRPDIWKPLIILNSYFFFMQFSGVPVLIAYAVNIMMSEGVSLEPYFATLLLGIVKLCFEVGAGFLQNKYGRRPLSMLSGLGMAFCMAALGLAHQLKADVTDSEQLKLLSWISLLSILAYVMSAAVGFFMIPWAMLGEVYPTEVAGLACGITTCLGNLFGFASIKLFPTFVVLMGGKASGNSINATEGVFYLYGVLTCVSVLYILFYLPETFRRTIQEVSEEFMRPVQRCKYCSGD